MAVGGDAADMIRGAAEKQYNGDNKKDADGGLNSG